MKKDLNLTALGAQENKEELSTTAERPATRKLDITAFGSRFSDHPKVSIKAQTSKFDEGSELVQSVKEYRREMRRAGRISICNAHNALVLYNGRKEVRKSVDLKMRSTMQTHLDGIHGTQDTQKQPSG